MTTLGELYDEDALARIDAAPVAARRRPSGRSSPAAVGALVVAVGLGIQELFEPRTDRPIVEDVDPRGEDGDGSIRITGMEMGPRRTVAWVLSGIRAPGR